MNALRWRAAIAPMQCCGMLWQPPTATGPAAGGSSSRYWGRSLGAIAAVLILAALMHYSGVLVYLSADYATATGQQRRVALPDGSTLLLNSGSAVALDFGAAHRRVRLIEGEAFFEVVRDPDRPFQVTGRFADVEVTGTAFAVRATGERDNVTLQHGSVSVLARSGCAAAVQAAASPRHRARRRGDRHCRTIDPDIAFAWLEGRIRFRDRPLGRCPRRIAPLSSRYHHRRQRSDHYIRVSGNYRIDDPRPVRRVACRSRRRDADPPFRPRFDFALTERDRLCEIAARQSSKLLEARASCTLFGLLGRYGARSWLWRHTLLAEAVRPLDFF